MRNIQHKISVYEHYSVPFSPYTCIYRYMGIRQPLSSTALLESVAPLDKGVFKPSFKPNYVVQCTHRKSLPFCPVWMLTLFYSYTANIMKFQFIYWVQLIWINLYIQHCWNQIASRLNCQHNLPKEPAHYLTLTSFTVWLLDYYNILYTDIQKKQIYSIHAKRNNLDWLL